MKNFQHKSVLLQEVIDGLAPKPNTNYVDATLGFAGHSKEILARTEPNGLLIGIDQDIEALSEATKTLEVYGKRFRSFHGNFDQLTAAIENTKINGGILADLGISSMQVDKEDRGFSFQKNGPLDMRMNRDNELSAETIVNEYSLEELTKIIYMYSDEKFAKRIATRICEQREKVRITDTSTLAQIVSEAIPRKFWPKSINPATRTFQALRIAVNDEIGVLERFLPQAVESLETGSRLAIITFHSIEDKIVKNYFKKMANPCECPATFPKCVCGKVPSLKIITKKAITPGEEELNDNKRSRSARLRIAEKI